MKPFFFFFSFLLLGYSCKNDSEAVKEIRPGGPNSDLVRNPQSADQPLDTNQLARLTFQEPEWDFGAVQEGALVEHEFRFTNTGKVPLSILDAHSSCGCTVPEWPEAPIPPGGSGVIKAKFNTTNRPGRQKKRITVTANTIPSETQVTIFGVVEDGN